MSDGQPFELRFTEQAERQLKRLDNTTIKQIMKKLLRWAENAESVPHEALTGQQIPFYRVRIGDFRVIYDLKRDNKVMMVVKIGHRRDVYNE